MSNGSYTPKMLAFHDAMRSLWQVHGTFTERAIVDYVGGLPDATDVIAHLQQNQVDIGNAIKPYYGAKAGNELTKLLHQHISDAVNSVVAAKAGDSAKLNAAEKAFYANGNQIASFLHSANPRNWSLKAMKTMMRIHLNQVLGLAVDQLKGHYNAAIKLYGAYINHLQVAMADPLSNGIMKQFPAKFR
ncbi:MAG: glycosyltransferase [Solirubrobacteraceae bacterium]